VNFTFFDKNGLKLQRNRLRKYLQGINCNPKNGCNLPFLHNCYDFDDACRRALFATNKQQEHLHRGID
jgi:hypothetical protein